MSLADRRDLSRARLELAINRQLTNLWAKALTEARNVEAGSVTDADGLAAYQDDRDRAIAAAARAILARADVLCDDAENVIRALIGGIA